jgi:hypothetical protein
MAAPPCRRTLERTLYLAQSPSKAHNLLDGPERDTLPFLQLTSSNPPIALDSPGRSLGCRSLP